MVSEQPPCASRRKHGEEFAEFFRKEYPKVVRFVMYAGATLEEADDAVSQAMAKAYTWWSQLAQPAAWVRTVALRRYIKESQHDRRRSEAEATAARLDPLSRGSTGSSCEPDEHGHVIAILRCLPPAQQEVMVLFLDRYSPTEIAALLGQDAVTVRSNLRHARSRLRRELQNLAATEKAVDEDKENS